MLSLRRFICTIVAVTAVLVENVLTLDLNIVDFRLQDLLAAHTILRLARVLDVVAVATWSFGRLFFNFEITFLLLA